MLKYLSNKRGYTLLELLITISIIVVLSAVIIAISSRARTEAAISRASSDVMQITGASQGWLIINSYNYSAISMTKLCEAKLLGENLCITEEGATLARNPWGGEYTISKTDNSQSGALLLITLTKVPTDICSPLAERLSSLGNTDYDGNNVTVEFS